MSCDAAAVDQLVAALARPGEHVAVAAAGWAPLCTGDGVLDSQLAQIATADRADWWIVELQTSVLDAHLWGGACAGGSRAMSMATKLDAGFRRPHLWTGCGLDKLGFAAEAEWSAAEGLLVMPILAAHTLKAGGIPTEKARPIVRALAGL